MRLDEGIACLNWHDQLFCTDPDVFLSEINQIRYERSVLDEAASTERLTTIILDALPAETYSTVKLEAIRDPDLSLEQIQRMRTFFINHSETFSATKKNTIPEKINSRIVGVRKMIGSQRCQLLSSLVATAKKQVMK